MKKSFVLNVDTLIECEKPLSKPVMNAVGILKRDMNKVFEPGSRYHKRNTIILVDANPEDHLEPETYAFHFISSGDNPDRMVLSGSDERAIIYGLLQISTQYLHIPPFWFWNDTVPAKMEKSEIPAEDFQSKPFRVRYRGWFINDEMLLLGWHGKKYDPEVWQPAFEALLRCGGNMVIPGTGESSRHLENMAANMGLIITQHHAEPLGAEMFAAAYPDKQPSYSKHSDLFIKIWEKGVLRQKGHEVIWNLGFRGQGDRPFWEDDASFQSPASRGKLIGEVIQKQYEIVCRYIRNPVCCTNLYGEVLQLYQDGFLQIPDGVIKIWADNGYGKMVSRRQGNLNPRVPALPGRNDKPPHGLYYHVTFHDLQASNHLTMGPNPPEMIANELSDAFRAGADEYLIVNCGNIKPHTYLLSLVSEIWANGQVNAESHLNDFVNTYYHMNSEDLKECYRSYFKSTTPYGTHEDEKAGEQFYHYPVRNIISHWLRGESEKTENRLVWLTGQKAFSDQVRHYQRICSQGQENWNKTFLHDTNVLAALPKEDRDFFNDSLLLQVVLHKTGCSGAVQICKSYLYFVDGDYLNSYLCACRSLESFKKGLKTMQRAEHGKWSHFYRNDCLTNVKLTVYFVDTLRRFLRIYGDGTEVLEWEKAYLYPESHKRVMLETTYTNQLKDDALYNRLKRIPELNKP